MLVTVKGPGPVTVPLFTVYALEPRAGNRQPPASFKIRLDEPGVCVLRMAKWAVMVLIGAVDEPIVTTSPVPPFASMMSTVVAALLETVWPLQLVDGTAPLRLYSRLPPVWSMTSASLFPPLLNAVATCVVALYVNV